MTSIPLLLLVLGGIAQSDPTPEEVVGKLGSSAFAEHMEAAFTLRRLGAEALPALRAARQAKDPTIRRRAAMLIDVFERNKLVRPTLIRLDFRDRSLLDVVTTVRDR